MLKQAVGVVASIVAIAVVGLILAVLVRLSWGQNGYQAPTPDPSPESDKTFRRA